MDGLSSICAGLGILDEDDNGRRIGYTKGEYCSDNLKDLLRFLRRDDPEKRDVFKQVCKWNIVGKDLIPIIEYCQEDRGLVLNAVKVLVFLTMPVESTSIDIPQQIEYLWGLKSAITYSDIVPVIVSLLEGPLENLENESFTEEDWKLVQLVLTLFRNILAIQDISIHQKAEGLATQFLSLRDMFLELLFKENVMDLILVLTQHTGGSHGYLRQDNLLILEIFFYIFNGQEPELIAKAPLKGSKVVAEDSVASLQSIMKTEQEKIKLTRLHKLPRHSQFTGIFTRVTTDGSKALFIGNPSTSSDALLKPHKNYRGPPKREVWDNGKLPSTKIQILQLVDDFVSQFLQGGYNVLMQSIREDIEKEHQEIESSDVVVFFQVAQFVTSFQYHKCLNSKASVDVENETLATSHDDNTLFRGSICGPIAETLNESMFQMVIAKWRYEYEALKQTNNYKFLSAAGSLLKIMIRMLDLVLKQSPEDSKEPQTVRILLYKLFYDQTEEGMTQFLLSLINSFDTHKQPKSDLANLVESMHVIVRLLETLQTRGTLRVSKKSRKKKAKKAVAKNGDVCEPSMPAAHNAVNSSSLNDPNTDMMEKETMIYQDPEIEADKGIKDSEATQQYPEIEADKGINDSESTHQDPDTEADKSIKNTIQIDGPVLKTTNLESNELEVEERNIGDKDGYLETDDSTDDEHVVLTNEVDFKPSSLVSALANNGIIQKLCWLLKFYKNNSASTNHYVISMLRRICDDLELSPMLYRLTYLTIFYDILEEQKLRPSKEYENIVTFLTSLVRRMLRKLKTYPLLFVEVLFAKTRSECQYINCGSLLNEFHNIKNEFREGRSNLKNGGNDCFEEQKWVRRSLADALGDDDFGVSFGDNQEGGDPDTENFQNLTQSSGEGNEISISAPNTTLDENDVSDRVEHSNEEPSRSSEKGNRLVLSNEMHLRLKHLHEKYKDNPKCCQLIARELDPNRKISKLDVSNLLMHLGFKVPAKAKPQKRNASHQIRDGKRDPSRSVADSNLTMTEESPSLRKPTHSRKRIQAFSSDQEEKIKALFEQFKDKKKCSSMIANALDSTGQITAARVTRKLKQLGLVVPKEKRAKDGKRLRDEVEISSDRAGLSDDETLLSLRKRGKQNQDENHYDEEKNKKMARKLPEDFSDDELLSSLVVKTKKKHSKADDDELMLDSFDKTPAETNSTDRDDTQIPGSDDFAKSNMMDSETRASDSEIIRDNLNESLFDELADFDEASTEGAVKPEKRRRLRMVVNFEEDDD